MCDANCRLCGVDVLSTGARRAVHIDAQVLLVEFDIHRRCLGQNGHRDGRGMHAPERLGLGNALHAMHAALVPQQAVCAVAADQCARVSNATDVGLSDREHLASEATRARPLLVHLKQLLSKEARFQTAGACSEISQPHI